MGFSFTKRYPDKIYVKLDRDQGPEACEVLESLGYTEKYNRTATHKFVSLEIRVNEGVYIGHKGWPDSPPYLRWDSLKLSDLKVHKKDYPKTGFFAKGGVFTSQHSCDLRGCEHVVTVRVEDKTDQYRAELLAYLDSAVKEREDWIENRKHQILMLRRNAYKINHQLQYIDHHVYQDMLKELKAAESSKP